MSPSPSPHHSDHVLLLYRNLAEWYPLLSPVADYVEAADFYRRLLEGHCQRVPATLLDLGSGAGHNAFHLKTTMACTLVDLAPAMLEQSRRLNPECQHIEGDMRSVRLSRAFDGVLVHDAISYMASRTDLQKAIATAFAHTAPGGVAIFQPDFVSETFVPGTETGGSDRADRALRFIEWRWMRDRNDEAYVTDMAYLLREASGSVEVFHERHLMGLFPRAVWLESIAAAGFEARVLPFEHTSYGDTGHTVFLGLRRISGKGA